jgi:hypothetical protein
VNKYHQARLSLLVNEEHTLVKPVRRGLDTSLGVQMLRPTLFEVLVCGGNLAGGVNVSRALGATTTFIVPLRPEATTKPTISGNYNAHLVCSLG